MATQADVLKVYLSSTRDDLVSYREAVMHTIRKLGHDYVAMEDYEASAGPVVRRCEEDVAACDVYLAIIAWRYGYISPGYAYSITDAEYRSAVASGMPRLVFMLAESFPWVPGLIDRDSPTAEKLEDFRARAQDENIVEFFTTPEDLAVRVTIALAKEAIRRRTFRSVGSAEAHLQLLRYQQWALDHYSFVDMIGIGAAGLTFPLDEIYIPLRLDQRPSLTPEAYRHEHHIVEFAQSYRLASNSNDASLSTALSTLRKERGILLLGEPGAGKTTFVRRLLGEVVSRGGAAIGLADDTIPVLLSLRHATRETLTIPIDRYIQQQLDKESSGQLSPDFAHRIWRRGNVLLLLDGLDEISDQDLQASVCRYIEEATDGALSRGVRLIMTCRSASFTLAAQFNGRLKIFELRSLNRGESETFVKRWFSAAAYALGQTNLGTTSDDQLGLLTKEIVAVLNQDDEIRRRLLVLLSSPLVSRGECITGLTWDPREGSHRAIRAGQRAARCAEPAYEPSPQVKPVMHSPSESKNN
ncbi:MAG: DUF4062 domain-containing protein [Pseudonocardia sp.]